MSKAKAIAIYTKNPQGEIHLLCNITETSDYSLLLKFPWDKAEIHIHPTGHINFKNIKTPTTIYIRDPFIYDGMQPIALLPYKSPKNSTLIATLETNRILETTANENSILVLISKYGVMPLDRPGLVLHIPDMFSLLIIEKRPGTSLQAFSEIQDSLIKPSLATLEKAEIAEKARYVQTLRLRQKGTLLRDPNFQELPKQERDRILEKIDHSGMLIKRAEDVLEHVFPVEMRVRPDIKLVDPADSLELIKLEGRKRDLDTVRAKFRLKQKKGGHFQNSLGDQTQINFDAEL